MLEKRKGSNKTISPIPSEVYEHYVRIRANLIDEARCQLRLNKRGMKGRDICGEIQTILEHAYGKRRLNALETQREADEEIQTDYEKMVREGFSLLRGSLYRIRERYSRQYPNGA